MVKVKYCGMTNLDDCQKAADLGVDFVGFVFYKNSKRYVTPEQVRGIIGQLKGSVNTVGVFVDESDREIKEMVEYCGLDYGQVYREVSIKNRIMVHRVGGTLPEPLSEGLILFDSLTKSFGGSGVSFDFSLLKGCGAIHRAFVAGGVNIDNVGQVLSLKPFGVDLVSAIEASPGKKDHKKMEEFMNTVRSYKP